MKNQQLNKETFKHQVQRICPFCEKTFDTICRNIIHLDGMPTGLHISGFEHIGSAECVERSLESGVYTDNTPLTLALMSKLCDRMRTVIRVDNTDKFVTEVKNQFGSKRFLWAIRFFGHSKNIIDILQSLNDIELEPNKENLERQAFAYGLLSTLDIKDDDIIIEEEAKQWIQEIVERSEPSFCDCLGYPLGTKESVVLLPWEEERAEPKKPKEKKKPKLKIVEDVIDDRDFILSLGEKARKQCEEKLKKLNDVN